MIKLVLAIFFLGISFIYSKELVPCKVLRVIDGDTFVCKIKGIRKERVRMIGIDTPESRPNRKAKRDARRSGRSLEEIIKLGKKATAFTKKFLKRGRTVFLEFDIEKRDRYGRLLAYVWLDDKRMLNEILIREGFAVVYTKPPNVKYIERFRKAQRLAIEERKGLWKEDL